MGFIVDYLRTPNASVDDKLKSLRDSVQLAIDGMSGQRNASNSSNSSQMADDEYLTVRQAIDLFLPVGFSINTEDANFDPHAYYPGTTWERESGHFIYAADDEHPVGTMGGSADAVVVSHTHATNDAGEYLVTSEVASANNTRVTYSSSGNRYVDGGTANMNFHHRAQVETVGVDGKGKNMPPYRAKYIWRRTA